MRITEARKTLTALLLTLVMFTTACWTVDQVLTDIQLSADAAGVIGAAISAVNPVDGQVISAVAQTASGMIAAVKTAYDAFAVSGAVGDRAKLLEALTVVQTQLPELLAAAHVVDPVAVAMAKAWVRMTVGIVTAILNVVGKVTLMTSNATIGKRLKLNMKAIPSSSSIRNQWQTEVCQGAAACSGLLK